MTKEDCRNYGIMEEDLGGKEVAEGVDLVSGCISYRKVATSSFLRITAPSASSAK
ncbi:hypothetical protein DPMN_079547 [Dreissena polymorpha]|uniref:Uncharacterized protein n=1 Tax=Dreissena polymorpha TaxID=45954 RepID=A0A9D4BRA9_DREPO|nr:hypothetical protein DPMN_079547 [Dreissena polymorpha]